MGTTYTPTSILSGFRSTVDLNAELPAIQAALADSISRSGATPNAMASDLDLGSNRMLNVDEGLLGTDGVNLNQVTQQITNAINASTGASQQQTTGDPITFNFGVATGSQGLNNRTEFDLLTLFSVSSFLGLTVVVNGVIQTPGLAYTIDPLILTKVIFTESLDAATDVMFIYGDLSPTPVFSNVNATLNEVAATATIGQLVFTAPTYVIGKNQLMVHIDGVMQSLQFADYAETTTTSVTLDTAMSGGERITIRNISGV